MPEHDGFNDTKFINVIGKCNMSGHVQYLDNGPFQLNPLSVEQFFDGSCVCITFLVALKQCFLDIGIGILQSLLPLLLDPAEIWFTLTYH